LNRASSFLDAIYQNWVSDGAKNKRARIYHGAGKRSAAPHPSRSSADHFFARLRLNIPSSFLSACDHVHASRPWS
jgi:hypothetical protein